MATGTLARERIDAAGRMVLHLQNRKYPVIAAFLVAFEESVFPRLYLVLDDHRQALAVREEVLTKALQEQDPNFDPYYVTLATKDEPITFQALKFMSEKGSRFNTYISGFEYRYPGVEQVYLYAFPLKVGLQRD